MNKVLFSLSAEQFSVMKFSHTESWFLAPSSELSCVCGIQSHSSAPLHKMARTGPCGALRLTCNISCVCWGAYVQSTRVLRGMITDELLIVPVTSKHLRVVVSSRFSLNNHGLIMDEKNWDPHNLFFSSFDFSRSTLSLFSHWNSSTSRSLLSLKFFSLLVLLTEEKKIFSLLDISNFAQFNTFTFGWRANFRWIRARDSLARQTKSTNETENAIFRQKWSEKSPQSNLRLFDEFCSVRKKVSSKRRGRRRLWEFENELRWERGLRESVKFWGFMN